MLTPEVSKQKVPSPVVIVAIGGGGDVVKRKALPQVYFDRNQFNPRLAFVGVDYKPFTEAEYRLRMRGAVESTFGLGSEEQWRNFEQRLFYIQGNFWGENAENREQDYHKLAKRLREIDSLVGTEGNFLVYFGLPYFLYVEVTRQLSTLGLLEAQRELSVA